MNIEKQLDLFLAAPPNVVEIDDNSGKVAVYTRKDLLINLLEQQKKDIIKCLMLNKKIFRDIRSSGYNDAVRDLNNKIDNLK